MLLGHFLSGTTEVLVTSANMSGTLDALEKAGISVENVVYIDPLNMQLWVISSDLTALNDILTKRGESLKILHRKGLLIHLKKIFRRPVLTVGVLCILLITCWLPSRVLFVQIEGNNHIPARQIIEQAEVCGIKFFASRREVRSEKMKNTLLAQMPQLQWAGINTKGCTAVITVRERNNLKNEKPTLGISHMIAMRDGVIKEITVLQGSALCQKGQTVKMGQVLISGYTDCGLCIKGSQAKGEVFAETRRESALILPTKYHVRRNISTSNKKFSLIIGKKRINFYKGSGISDTTCAKIYEEKYMTLPGGYVLPIAIAWESSLEYETQSETICDADSILSNYASRYLQQQMLSGSIIMADNKFIEEEDYWRMDGVFCCYEIIGITRTEELITRYE